MIIKKVLFAILPLVFYVVGGLLLGLFVRTISVNGGFEDIAFFLSGVVIGVPIFSAVYGTVAFLVYRNVWIPALINTITVLIPIVFGLQGDIKVAIPLVILFSITLIPSIITKLIISKKAQK